MLYIILKHMIWRTRIYSLCIFEIFKYWEHMSNDTFRKIHKNSFTIVKFEYFAKQTIYS